MSQGDAQSRAFSADHLEGAVNPAMIKSILSYLNDKITTFLMSGQDPALQTIKIEGDLVTSFFESVNKLSDMTLYNFIEDLKKDIELIMQVIFNSGNEMTVFFTYLLILLKKLSPTDHSFTNTVHMIKNLAREINDQSHAAFAAGFNKFFINHLLRNYCSIIIESP